MKMCLLLRSSVCSLALVGLMAGLSFNLQAAAIMTMTGTTDETRNASEAELHLSLLGWTADDQQAAVVNEYKKYAESHDQAGFETFLRGLETKGYFFTHSPLGYTVKYAWQDTTSPDRGMVLLVVPALKKNDPYMWKTENTAPEPFSLLEVKVTGDTATVKSSLDGKIAVTGDGKLQLEDYNSAQVFATLKDATPYYLKH